MTAFLESCPVPILRCDRERKVLYMNPAFSRLLEGFNLESHRWHQLLPKGCWVHVSAQPLERHAVFNFKGDFQGHPFEFTLMSDESKDELFVMINDFTEQLQTQVKLVDCQREMEFMNQQIQESQAPLIQSEKMASLGRLIVGIAHEINTPIGSINSNNDVLIRTVHKLRDFLDCGDCPLEVKQHPEVIKIMKVMEEVNLNNHMACDYIGEILVSLKDFTRLDATKKQKVDLHKGLNSILTLVHHHLKNRIQVVKEYGVLPDVVCYPNRLNQVFMNILVNASQAISGQGIVTIKTFPKDENVKIMISDSGTGIRKENLVHIFDPGFTTKGEDGGTGLGLSICQKIMEDHHGKIEVDSESDQGTTFTLTLPIK